MKVTYLDYLLFGGYMLAMLLMGLYFSRKNTDTEQYFVGGRSFSGWIVGLSLVGTSISSVTFLAFPADAFKSTWLRFLPTFGLPIAALIAAIFVLPIYRRLNLTSAYEYLEHRFGPSIRVYGAVAFIVGQVFRLSIILYLVSLLMHEMTGWNLTLCIFLLGVFVAFYTIVGGIDAVIWTDVIQTVVLALGGLLCVAVIILKLPGGLGEILSVGFADHKLSFGEMQLDGSLKHVGWGLSLGSKTGTMMLMLGVVAYLTEYLGNQNTVQRYAASRSTSEARKAMFVCTAASIPIWAFYMFLGTALYVFFKAYPTPESIGMLTGELKPEQIMPYYIINYLPSGVTGLVISAAMAAAMSSLDSSINAISAVGVTDIYKRHLATGKSDRHYLKAAWVLATLSGVIMVAGALILAVVNAETLQHVASVIGSLLGAGLLGMYLLGFFTRRGDARAVWSGIICTLVFTSWTVISAQAPDFMPEWLTIPFDLYYTGMIGNLVMFVVGYGVSLLIPSKNEGRNLDSLTVWTGK